MEDGAAEFVLGVPVAPQLALPLGLPLEELLLVGLLFAELLFAELPQPDSSANVRLAPKMKNKRFEERKGPM
jgi:hypothetical protein